MTIDRHTVSVNGITLSYRDQGRGDVVLLLHGFPDDADVWDGQIAALVAAGYRAIAPDLRGYGQSDAPLARADYAMEHILGDLTALLDHLGVARVFLIGHDWGALVGWAMCINYPARVRRYMALSVGHPTAYIRAGLRQKLKGYYVFIFKIPRFSEWALLRNDGAALRRIAPSMAVGDHWVAAMKRPGRMTAALNYYRENMKFLAPQDWPLVTVPVFGVWSDQDVALAEDQMVNSARYMAADWRYQCIKGSAHWMMHSHGDAVNELMLRYFGDTTIAG